MLSKDKVVLLTKGAFSFITEMELIKGLESKKESNEKAISMINVIKNKRHKHQENATIIILEIKKVFL